MSLPDLLPNPPHIVGPTWQRLATGGFYLPEKHETIGDQVVNWMYRYLVQPEGPRAGQPFIPTAEQYRFILWWFAVDANNRFVYRSGLLRRLKGWGKDPLVAALSLAELCGPVKPYSRNFANVPVGTRQDAPWIQIAAVSQDQTRNTFSLFPSMISGDLKKEFGLEVHRTVIYSKKGGAIEAATSSPLALEGKRPTFVVMNEVQWWIAENKGHAMYDVIAGNVDKSAYGTGRYLAICNAHRPGEDSIGEKFYANYLDVLAGNAIDTGLLYDSLEAPSDTPVSEIPPENEDPEGFAEGIAKLRRGLEVARGDAVWLDIDNLIKSILDKNNSVSESRRKFLNQVNAVEDSWLAPSYWNACYDDKLGLLPEKGDRITLGFDGSKSNDWTALVACRGDDGALFLIKAWNPENYQGGIPRQSVDAMVRSCFERYDVVAFRADVHEFEAYVDQWSRDFKRKLKVNAAPNSPVAFDMRGQKKKFAFDCERFREAVLSTHDAIQMGRPEDRVIAHNGDKTLLSHVTNA